MKKIVLVLVVGFITLSVSAQRFTLSRNLVVDTLLKNSFEFDEGVNLKNNSSDRIVIKYRTYINTIDTANWEILYCDFRQCKSTIAYENICDTMDAKGGEFSNVRISNFSIVTNEFPKDCELCVEFFEVTDSTYRDTLCYKLGSKMEYPTGIRYSINKNYTKIFPNPTNSIVTIESSDKINSIFILDLSGKLIEKHENINSTSNSFDLSALKPGSYLIRVENGNGEISNKKLIIE